MPFISALRQRATLWQVLWLVLGANLTETECLKRLRPVRELPSRVTETRTQTLPSESATLENQDSSGERLG